MSTSIFELSTVVPAIYTVIRLLCSHIILFHLIYDCLLELVLPLMWREKNASTFHSIFAAFFEVKFEAETLADAKLSREKMRLSSILLTKRKGHLADTVQVGPKVDFC